MSVISRTKNYAKLKESKEKARLSSDVLIKVLIPIVRWFLTITSLYSVSTVFVVGLVPFTTAYLAGATQMSLKIDAITGLSSWVFPSIAATILLSVLCLVIDYKIYKFFKKYLSYSYFVEKRNNIGKNNENKVKLSSRKK